METVHKYSTQEKKCYLHFSIYTASLHRSSSICNKKPCVAATDSRYDQFPCSEAIKTASKHCAVQDVSLGAAKTLSTFTAQVLEANELITV